MTNFFSSVIEFISLAWDFLMTAVKSFITVFQLLLSSIPLHNLFLSNMPIFISSCFMLVYGILLLKFLIGRMGGTD